MYYASICMYMYMTLIIHEMLKKKGKATPHTKQHNTTCPRQLIFKEKNSLPRVGFKPTTVCFLGNALTNFTFLSPAYIVHYICTLYMYIFIYMYYTCELFKCMCACVMMALQPSIPPTLPNHHLQQSLEAV